MAGTTNAHAAAQGAGVAGAIGEVLRARREELGLTRVRVAVAIGVDPSTIQRWENGGSVPTFDVLVLAADELGLDLDELVGIVRDRCPRWDLNPRSSDYNAPLELVAGGDVVTLTEWRASRRP